MVLVADIIIYKSEVWRSLKVTKGDNKKLLKSVTFVTFLYYFTENKLFMGFGIF